MIARQESQGPKDNFYSKSFHGQLAPDLLFYRAAQSLQYSDIKILDKKMAGVRIDSTVRLPEEHRDNLTSLMERVKHTRRGSAAWLAATGEPLGLFREVAKE